MGVANRIAALVGGMALTLVAATVGLCRLDAVIHRTTWSCRGAAGTETRQDDVLKRVKLGPTGLYYFEGENSLKLVTEMASDRRGAYYIVYVWTPTTWVREMPEWCRYRREEILLDIKRLTSDKRIKWVEEE